MEILIKLFDVIIPVYVIIGIGYYIGKKDKKFNTEFITNFAAKIGSPAMIFYTITTTGITLSIFRIFLYALILIVGFSIVGVIFLIFLKKIL